MLPSRAASTSSLQASHFYNECKTECMDTRSRAEECDPISHRPKSATVHTTDTTDSKESDRSGLMQPLRSSKKTDNARDSFKVSSLQRVDMLSGFTDVDRSPDPSSYVKYVALTNSQPAFQSSKACLHQLLKPKAGDHILDVGCGLGFDSVALAQLVGTTGSVVGIDRSKTMITEARKRAGASGLPVQFHVGDAHRIEYEASLFDACFIASTLMHIKDPTAALSEIIRVLRSDGRVVALECDWETLVMGFDNPKLEKRIVTILRRAIRNPGIGHQLPILFDKLGLRGIGVAAWTLPLFDYVFADQVWRSEEHTSEL